MPLSPFSLGAFLRTPLLGCGSASAAAPAAAGNLEAEGLLPAFEDATVSFLWAHTSTKFMFVSWGSGLAVWIAWCCQGQKLEPLSRRERHQAALRILCCCVRDKLKQCRLARSANTYLLSQQGMLDNTIKEYRKTL